MPATIVALAENTLQALNRVVSVLRGRDFKILSVTPGRTKKPNVISATIVVDSARTKPDRVVACLEKLDEVLQVAEIPSDRVLNRELALLKLTKTPEAQRAIDSLLASYGARVMDQTRHEMTLEIVGEPSAVQSAFELLDASWIVEFVRVGPAAIPCSITPPE